MISDLEISSEFKPNQSINSKLIVIPDKLTNAIKYIADTGGKSPGGMFEVNFHRTIKQIQELKLTLESFLKQSL